MPHETNCFLSLAVNKMTENARVLLKFCISNAHSYVHSIMYKDHPDVYDFFIEGVYITKVIEW